MGIVPGNGTLREVLGPPGGLTSRMEIIIRGEKQDEEVDLDLVSG